jgi:hypothetical protein
MSLLKSALKTLSLESPFTLIELKAAYRKAALKTHPDMGGSKTDFIAVDQAYDYLKSLANLDESVNSSYWEKRLPELEKKFKAEWKNAYKQVRKDRTGLWYSTCIERFARSYIDPKPEWFKGVIFGKKATHADAEEYRAFLATIAPNRRHSENWARKYYQLEFGDRLPWVFYLPGRTA